MNSSKFLCFLFLFISIVSFAYAGDCPTDPTLNQNSSNCKSFEEYDYSSGDGMNQFFEQASPPWDEVAQNDGFWTNLPEDKVSLVPLEYVNEVIDDQIKNINPEFLNEVEDYKVYEQWDTLEDKSHLSEEKITNVLNHVETGTLAMSGVKPTLIQSVLSGLKKGLNFLVNSDKISFDGISLTDVNGATYDLNELTTQSSETIIVNEDGTIEFGTPTKAVSGDSENDGDSDSQLPPVDPNDADAQTETTSGQTDSSTPQANLNLGAVGGVTSDKSFKMELTQPTLVKTPDGNTIIASGFLTYDGENVIVSNQPGKNTAAISDVNQNRELIVTATTEKVVINPAKPENEKSYVLFEKATAPASVAAAFQAARGTVSISGQGFSVQYDDKLNGEQEIFLPTKGTANIKLRNNDELYVLSTTGRVILTNFIVDPDKKAKVPADRTNFNMPSKVFINSFNADDPKAFGQTYTFDKSAQTFNGKIYMGGIDFMTEKSPESEPFEFDWDTSVSELLDRAKNSKTYHKPSDEQLAVLFANMYGVTKADLEKHGGVNAAQFPPDEGRVIMTNNADAKENPYVSYTAWVDGELKTIVVEPDANGKFPLSQLEKVYKDFVGDAAGTSLSPNAVSYLNQKKATVGSSSKSVRDKVSQALYVANLKVVSGKDLPVTYDANTDSLTITNQAEFDAIVNSLSESQKTELFARISRQEAIIASESGFDPYKTDGNAVGQPYVGVAQISSSEAQKGLTELGLTSKTNPSRQELIDKSLLTTLAFVGNSEVRAEALSKYGDAISEYSVDFAYNAGLGTYDVFRSEFSGYTADKEREIANALETIWSENKGRIGGVGSSSRSGLAIKGNELLSIAKSDPRYAELFKDFDISSHDTDSYTVTKGTSNMNQNLAVKLYTFATRIHNQNNHLGDLADVQTGSQSSSLAQSFDSFASNYGIDVSQYSSNQELYSVLPNQNIPRAILVDESQISTEPNQRDISPQLWASIDKARDRLGRSDQPYTQQDVYNGLQLHTTGSLSASNGFDKTVSQFGNDVFDLVESQDARNTVINRDTYELPKVYEQGSSSIDSRIWDAVHEARERLGRSGKPYTQQDVYNGLQLYATGSLSSKNGYAQTVTEFGDAAAMLVANEAARNTIIDPATFGLAPTNDKQVSLSIQTQGKRVNTPPVDAERDAIIQHNLDLARGSSISRNGVVPAHCTASAHCLIYEGPLKPDRGGIVEGYSEEKLFEDYRNQATTSQRQNANVAVGHHIQYYHTGGPHSAIVYNVERLADITVNGVSYPAWNMRSVSSSGGSTRFHYRDDRITTAPIGRTQTINGVNYGRMWRQQDLPSDSPLLQRNTGFASNTGFSDNVVVSR